MSIAKLGQEEKQAIPRAGQRPVFQGIERRLKFSCQPFRQFRAPFGVAGRRQVRDAVRECRKKRWKHLDGVPEGRGGTA